MSTIFVVRETSHPEADLARNWSSPTGGFSNGEMCGTSFASAEAAKAHWDAFYQDDVPAPDFRFHPAYGSFTEVHYEGLGAWNLEAETLEEAIAEATTCEWGLTVNSGAGDGHFLANEVVSFHKVREDLYVFEIACA
jgi:hypothetical protein